MDSVEGSRHFCINIGGQVDLLTGIETALLRASPCARVILCALRTNYGYW